MNLLQLRTGRLSSFRYAGRLSACTCSLLGFKCICSLFALTWAGRWFVLSTVDSSQCDDRDHPVRVRLVLGEGWISAGLVGVQAVPFGTHPFGRGCFEAVVAQFDEHLRVGSEVVQPG